MTIGDTLTDPADPRPLPRLDVDAPTLRMTFGVNTSPLSGREGKYVTSRQIKARLDRETLGNVSIEVRPTEIRRHVRGPRPGRAPAGRPHRADAARGLRADRLAARRSSSATVDGEIQEPYERITIDIPPDYIGAVQEALAGRKGRLEQMTTDADGRVRMEFVLPVRGLIGYRGQLLTDTRGTALLHQIGEGYGPWAGEVTHRTNGVLVADRSGTSNAYGLFNLEERGELFIGAGVEVYEGMIIGESSRSGDMDVNATKEKKLTNIRTHSHDESLRLTPPRPLTLESAIEFIAADELVEVTPLSIRLRKRALSEHERRREKGREEDLSRAARREAPAEARHLAGGPRAGPATDEPRPARRRRCDRRPDPVARRPSRPTRTADRRSASVATGLAPADRRGASPASSPSCRREPAERLDPVAEAAIPSRRARRLEHDARPFRRGAATARQRRGSGEPMATSEVASSRLAARHAPRRTMR